MAYKLLISTVKPDVTDSVVEAAKAAGARGATIIPGRGTGTHEAKTFFGLSLEEQTDIILVLLPTELLQPVMDAISKAGRFDQPGTGIAFAMEVVQTAGLGSQSG